MYESLQFEGQTQVDVIFRIVIVVNQIDSTSDSKNSTGTTTIYNCANVNSGLSNKFQLHILCCIFNAVDRSNSN